MPAKKAAAPKRIRYQDTSGEAWRDWQGLPSETLDARIVDTLHGTKGLMCWEIERALGAIHQSVSGNMAHLKKKGYVVETGRSGRTPSGRSAMILALAKKRVKKPAKART